MLCSTITNIAQSIYGKKGAKETSPYDFIPDWGGSEEDVKPQQTVQEMKDILLRIARRGKKRRK